MAYDDKPEMVDRLFAAAIAIPFSIPVGSGVQALLSWLGLETNLFFWLVILCFGAYGFLKPRQSRDLLTKLWNDILDNFKDSRY